MADAGTLSLFSKLVLLTEMPFGTYRVLMLPLVILSHNLIPQTVSEPSFNDVLCKYPPGGGADVCIPVRIPELRG